MMTLRITGPVKARVLRVHPTFTIGWEIASPTAMTTVGITDHVSAFKLPSVMLLVPVPLLPLIPLIVFIPLVLGHLIARKKRRF